MKFLGFVSERAFSCGFLLLFSFLLLLLVGFLLVFWQFFFLLLLLVFFPLSRCSPEGLQSKVQ